MTTQELTLQRQNLHGDRSLAAPGSFTAGRPAPDPESVRSAPAPRVQEVQVDEEELRQEAFFREPGNDYYYRRGMYALAQDMLVNCLDVLARAKELADGNGRARSRDDDDVDMMAPLELDWLMGRPTEWRPEESRKAGARAKPGARRCAEYTPRERLSFVSSDDVMDCIGLAGPWRDKFREDAAADPASMLRKLRSMGQVLDEFAGDSPTTAIAQLRKEASGQRAGQARPQPQLQVHPQPPQGTSTWRSVGWTYRGDGAGPYAIYEEGLRAQAAQTAAVETAELEAAAGDDDEPDSRGGVAVLRGG